MPGYCQGIEQLAGAYCSKIEQCVYSENRAKGRPLGGLAQKTGSPRSSRYPKTGHDLPMSRDNLFDLSLCKFVLVSADLALTEKAN